MSEVAIGGKLLVNFIKGVWLKRYLSALSMTLGFYLLGQKLFPGNVFTVEAPSLLLVLIPIYAIWVLGLGWTIFSLGEMVVTLAKGHRPKLGLGVLFTLGLFAGLALSGAQKNLTDIPVNLFTFAIGSGLAWIALGAAALIAR